MSVHNINSTDDFRPALIVVDMQEDFCAPHGSLGIDGGRELAPLINRLLSLPFALRVATQDYHQPGSLTFASAHNLPPFTSTATLSHPTDPSQTYTAKLWPDHCVADTPGANIIPELDSGKFDIIVRKAMDRRSEMYSGFRDCFGRTLGAKHGEGIKLIEGSGDGDPSDTNLAERLREKGVKQVYCVGLAGDVCVKSTALDAVKEGFEAYWIEEGQKCVDAEREDKAKAELREKGVKVVSVEDDEMKRVWAMVA